MICFAFIVVARFITCNSLMMGQRTTLHQHIPAGQILPSLVPVAFQASFPLVGHAECGFGNAKQSHAMMGREGGRIAAAGIGMIIAVHRCL